MLLLVRGFIRKKKCSHLLVVVREPVTVRETVADRLAVSLKEAIESELYLFILILCIFLKDFFTGQSNFS